MDYHPLEEHWWWWVLLALVLTIRAFGQIELDNQPTDAKL